MRRIIAVVALMLFVGANVGFADVTQEEMQKEVNALHAQIKKTQAEMQAEQRELVKDQQYLQVLSGAVAQLQAMIKNDIARAKIEVEEVEVKEDETKEEPKK